MTITERMELVFGVCREIDPEYAPTAAAAIPGQRMNTWRRSPKVHWVMSVRNMERDSYPGQVTEVNTFVAAECIYSGTHRLATAQEIAAEQLRREQARQGILTEEQARISKGTTVQVTPEALREAIAGLGLKQE